MPTQRQLFRVATTLALAVACLLGPALAMAQSTEKVRIAVMNFENNSTWSYWGDNLGRAAADELVTQLFQTGSFSVIERAQLDALLAEQNLGASGRVDQSTAARIGQLLGGSSSSSPVRSRSSPSSVPPEGSAASVHRCPGRRASSMYGW